MKCNDQSVAYLKSLGYNVVRLPKTDIKPLQVLMLKNGFLETLGLIDSVLVAGQNKTLPEIKTNEDAADISGKKTNDMSAGVALSLLGNIIGAMGGKLGIDVQYAHAKTINFEFEDVKTDSVDIIKLDMYLNDADIDPLSKQVRALMESDDIYIITSIIKSNKISVEGTKKDNSGLKVDIPVVKEIVGGKINVNSSGDQASRVSYSGDTMLVFGFKAIRLIYENGKYTAFENVDNGTSMSLTTTQVENKGTVEWLPAQSSLVQIIS